MQRIAIPALFSIFVSAPAAAGPLNLHPDSPQGAFAQVFSVPALARPQPAPVERTTYGGGFLDFLFRGPAGGQQIAPPQPPFSLRQPYGDPQGPEIIDPSAPGGRFTMNPRFLRQEVSYEGKERPGTVIIN